MKPSQVLKEVQAAWWALERVAGHTELLDECVRESERVEREHRAMGKRWMRGIETPRYALSVDWAARYFVARHVAEHMPIPQSWSAFEGYRADVAMSQALRECLQKDRDPAKRNAYRAFVKAHAKTLNAIDYAGDIALPCKGAA